MERTGIISFSSNVKHYEVLYRYAAILENVGYITLVPIDVYGLLPDAKIYNEKLEYRNGNDLDDMRKRRIDLSDSLIVYIDGDDELLIDENTIKDISYAADTNKEIWISYDHIFPIAVKKYIEIGLGNYGIKFIELDAHKVINLNGGYSIHMRQLIIYK